MVIFIIKHFFLLFLVLIDFKLEYLAYTVWEVLVFILLGIRLLLIKGLIFFISLASIVIFRFLLDLPRIISLSHLFNVGIIYFTIMIVSFLCLIVLEIKTYSV